MLVVPTSGRLRTLQARTPAPQNESGQPDVQRAGEENLPFAILVVFVLPHYLFFPTPTWNLS